MNYLLFSESPKGFKNAQEGIYGIKHFDVLSLGTVTKEEVDEVIQRYDTICEEAFKKAGEERQIYHKHWLDSPWSGFFEGKDPLKVTAKF